MQDLQALEQRITNQLGQAMNAQLGPIMTAIQALTAVRQQTSKDEEDDDNNPPPRQQGGLTVDQVRQLITEARSQDSTNNRFVPKTRQASLRAFKRSLTPTGKEMFDKYEDEVEEVLERLTEEQQALPEAWEQAFEFAMVTNHKQEYIKAMAEDLKPEDLPPHLQTPGGNGATPAADVDLTDDEKEMQPIFDRTYKGGFTPKQMKDYGEFAGKHLTLDQMIAQAREKGLIPNGAATGQTNKGNNA
jgi:hypothetical protein